METCSHETNIYSDSSGINGKIGSAAIMFKQGVETRTLRKLVGDECHHTVYKAEVVGLALVAQLMASENLIKQAIIGADNQVAIQALEHLKGTPGQHLVDQLHKRMEEIHNRHGHEGIKGKKRADKEAKKAARGNTSPDDQLPIGLRGRIKTSRSVARQNHFTRIKTDASKQFENSPRYPRLHDIDLSTPSSRFRKSTECLPHEQAALLIQLRTSHIPFRKYLHRIGKTNSPMCQTCTSQRETTHHFLMTCPAYPAARRQMEKRIGRSVRSMKILLTNPKVFPHLSRYISSTCRFNHIITSPSEPEP